MTDKKTTPMKYRVGVREAWKLIWRHTRKRVSEQIRAVASIILYLLLFQTIVLRIPIIDASLIAIGLGFVVMGLTFFMEGLLIGLMPLGEEIGIKLPQKTGIGVILIIAFILGVGATFAEPAVGVLRAVGQSVKAWEAPLLFLFLNKYSSYLVNAVGFGVGTALIFGMLRFLYGWSLKPFIYILISVLVGLSLYSYLDPNLQYMLGLAWDCGGVTTGPVTVPLVLALGIGISQVANKGRDDNTESGFGVVTLASLFPIIAVLMISIVMMGKVPKPMDDVDFFNSRNRAMSLYLFEDEQEMRDYSLREASFAAQLELFDRDKDRLNSYVRDRFTNSHEINNVFGSIPTFRSWLIKYADEESHQHFIDYLIPEHGLHAQSGLVDLDIGSFSIKHIKGAIQAIIPLTLFLLLVLYLILRERLSRADEIFLGLAFAIIGMAVFSGGVELGLSRLGDQIGSNLPRSFASLKIEANQQLIPSFDQSLVNTALRDDGTTGQFFYLQKGKEIITVLYDESYFDSHYGVYNYVPVHGPLFGDRERNFTGLLIVLLFAFIMGYSATLAEPALNALGLTVEDITVGAFKKSLLIQSVAIGVGIGIMLGVAKIIWNIPLFWLLAPPYLILLLITKLSTEEFVNIGWDSAGVTTGPITVPLVLAMGLGIGSQVGVVEGFGILSLASVCPIITVLGMGLYVNFKRKAVLKDLETGDLDLPADEVKQ